MTGLRTSARRRLGRFSGILGGGLIVLLGILIGSIEPGFPIYIAIFVTF